MLSNNYYRQNRNKLLQHQSKQKKYEKSKTFQLVLLILHSNFSEDSNGFTLIFIFFC